jgi:outer membrane protein assembly factor BamB
MKKNSKTNSKYILIRTAIFLAVLFFACNNSMESSAKKTSSTDSIPPNKEFKEKIKFINTTFLGNFQRTYYGDSLPENLNLNWKILLGHGKTIVGKDTFDWAGAGWTGQPILFQQDSDIYLLQGTYSHQLKKINIKTAKVVWEYAFDDVIKGTSTLWINKQDTSSMETRYIAMQGARQGTNKTMYSPVVPSFRAISLISGKELWELNVWHTPSYSRDVDASAAYIGDTAYLGLENGKFISFKPDPATAKMAQGIKQPQILDTATLYEKNDAALHRGNLVTEASPAILGNRVYLASGSGHIYGYNLTSKKIDWQFDIGSDIDGSPIVTNDSCLLISIEKQYISGHGGALKLDPTKTGNEAVKWFFPVPDRQFASWQGGIIGSIAVSDFYQKDSVNQIAAFNTIKGNFYVVMHTATDSSELVKDFNLKNSYYQPKVIFSYNTGPSISTPIIIPPRILVAGYNGIFLFEYDKNYNFKLLAKLPGGFESTPFAYKGKIYIASRDGNLYSFGN